MPVASLVYPPSAIAFNEKLPQDYPPNLLITFMITPATSTSPIIIINGITVVNISLVSLMESFASVVKPVLSNDSEISQ